MEGLISGVMEFFSKISNTEEDLYKWLYNLPAGTSL